MKVLDNELVVMVDVDDTLLCYVDPTIPSDTKIPILFAGKEIYLTPHTYHIDLVKMYKKRGYLVIVWSANGFAHAMQAVEKLGLESSVDFCMSKPTKHLDDNPDAGSILGPRVFCADLTKEQHEKIN